MPPHRTTSQWLNPAAFPYLNLQTASGIGVGRFGNAPVGGVVGPGTANFSLSMMKNLALYEKSKFQFGIEAANIFNHRNYEPPNMQVRRHRLRLHHRIANRRRRRPPQPRTLRPHHLLTVRPENAEMASLRFRERGVHISLRAVPEAAQRRLCLGRCDLLVTSGILDLMVV